MNNEQDKSTTKKNHDKVERKKEDSIYELENGNFLVIVQKRINGKVRTKKSRNVKGIQEARSQRKKFNYELNQEDLKHRDGQFKWQIAYGKYLAHIRQKISDSQGSHKPMGEGSYEMATSAYKYTKHWQGLFISQISAQHVYSMMQKPEFKNLSYGVKKHYMRHIRTAFKFNLGPSASIYLNPAHGIYLPRDKNEEPHQVQWIRPEFMERIIDQQHDKDMIPLTKWAPIFYIAYYTGLRSGELYALKWEDVDLTKENCLNVKSTFNWKTKKLTPTKTGQSRHVDITAFKKYFIKHKLQNSEKVFVFSRDKEWEGGKAARAFREALKNESVGFVPEKNFKGKELWPNFHSLRASYIMNLLTAGVPHLVVQSQCGHADYKTLKFYTAKLKAEDIQGVSHKLKPYFKSRKSG